MIKPIHEEGCIAEVAGNMEYFPVLFFVLFSFLIHDSLWVTCRYIDIIISCVWLPNCLPCMAETYLLNSRLNFKNQILPGGQIVAGGHKVSPKQICWLHFQHTFQLNKMKFSMVMKRFKLNIMILRLSKGSWIKGNNCRFLDCENNKNLMLVCMWLCRKGFHANLVWW